MATELSPGAQKVQRWLEEHGVPIEVQELPDSTRTVEEAAQAIGCAASQIAKSVVFRGERTGDPVLAVASGSNRVDTRKLAQCVGEPVAKADADYVRERTGFAIGGVPPGGHKERLRTFLDEDLLQFEEIWAAAGTARAVFCLRSADLTGLTGGTVADIRQ